MQAPPSPAEPVPDVSVVVVGYRSEGHIGACLLSLPAAADGLCIEVIVVDNSPDDQTACAVREAFPSARLLTGGGNLGFARGANLGFGRARARFVLFVNPDARLHPGSLRALLSVLTVEPRAAAAGPSLLWPDGRPAVSARPGHSLRAILFESLLLDRLFPSSRWVVRAPHSRHAVAVPCLSGACMLVAREAFESLGRFDERFFLYGEDVDFCRRALAAGRSLWLVPGARAVHDVAASSRLDPERFQVDLHRAKWQLIAKHERGWRRALAATGLVGGLGLRVALRSLAPQTEQAALARHEWSALRAVTAEARAEWAAAAAEWQARMGLALRRHGLRLLPPHSRRRRWGRRLAAGVPGPWRARARAGAPPENGLSTDAAYRAWLRARVRVEAGAGAAPHVVCVVPASESQADARPLLDSLHAQQRATWELRLASRHGPASPVAREGDADAVAVVEPSARLAPNALARLAAVLREEPGVDVAFADADFMDSAGRRGSPWFKPDWSPEMLLSVDLLAGTFAVRPELWPRLNRLNGDDVEPRHAFSLRVAEAAREGRRVPEVLTHLRAPPSAPVRPQERNRLQRAIGQHLVRRGHRQVDVEWTAAGWPVPRWQPAAEPLVSVVIPSRDNADLLAECLGGLFGGTSYRRLEVVVVDDGSREPATRSLYDRYLGQPSFRVVPGGKPFNFGAACNRGARLARGDALLFLNNDTRIVDPSWLERRWCAGSPTSLASAPLTPSPLPRRSASARGRGGRHGGLHGISVPERTGGVTFHSSGLTTGFATSARSPRRACSRRATSSSPWAGSTRGISSPTGMSSTASVASRGASHRLHAGRPPRPPASQDPRSPRHRADFVRMADDLQRYGRISEPVLPSLSLSAAGVDRWRRCRSNGEDQPQAAGAPAAQSPRTVNSCRCPTTCARAEPRAYPPGVRLLPPRRPASGRSRGRRG